MKEIAATNILNIFDKDDKEVLLDRVNKLTPSTPALWGKMSVAQMLAHCNIVPFEMIYERPLPNPVVRLIMKWLVKPTAAGQRPYQKNKPTGPGMAVTSPKDFETEKARLVAQINKTHQLGLEYFTNKISPFGKLTQQEWINLFYKHLHHHLTQFGV